MSCPARGNDINMNEPAKGEVVLYKSPEGQNILEVKLQDETVWLTQKQMASLFETERSVVTKHIRNVLRTQELPADLVCANFAHTAEDGKVYQTNYYSLDMVISVGYRVNSRRGTEFRIWASKVLREHISKATPSTKSGSGSRINGFWNCRRLHPV
jgi:hypothetical protein